MNALPIIEYFYSIQGEGPLSGRPSFFIRVTGCNLRCVFGNSTCDTPYTSIDATEPLYNNVKKFAEEFSKLLNTHPECKDIVITGGEPLLYQKGVNEFINIFPDYNYTIETNGSICPEEYIINKNITFSCSPKLESSIDNRGILSEPMRELHKRKRLSKLALDKINNSKHYFKFVYSQPSDIDSIMKLVDELKLTNIYLMPEGTTREQLNNKREECVNYCLQKGWNYTDRIHIIIWNDKKGV